MSRPTIFVFAMFLILSTAQFAQAAVLIGVDHSAPYTMSAYLSDSGGDRLLHDEEERGRNEMIITSMEPGVQLPAGMFGLQGLANDTTKTMVVHEDNNGNPTQGYMATTNTANSVVVPMADGGYDGADTTILVQNTAPFTGSVHFNLYTAVPDSPGPASVASASSVTLGPGQAASLDVGKLFSSSGFPGAAIMTSTATLAGAAVHSTSSGQTFAHPAGEPTYDDRLFPVLHNGDGGWLTEVEVFNAGDNTIYDTDNIFRYWPVTSTKTIAQESTSILPKNRVNYDPSTQAGLSAGNRYTGIMSIDVTNTGYAAMARSTNLNTGQTMSYQGLLPKDVQAELSFPYVKWDNNGLNTSLYIENMYFMTDTVELYAYDSTGSPLAGTPMTWTDVGPLHCLEIDMAATFSTTSTFFGSALVRAVSNRDVLAGVAESTSPTSAMAYAPQGEEIFARARWAPFYAPIQLIGGAPPVLPPYSLLLDQAE